jgi:hypothetical protein
MPGAGKTVLRGGYRDQQQQQRVRRTPDNAYGQLVGLGTQSINAFQGGSTQLRSILTPRPDAPGFSPVPGFAAPTLPTLPITYATANAAAGKQGLVWVFDPNIQAPLVHEYNCRHPARDWLEVGHRASLRRQPEQSDLAIDRYEPGRHSQQRFPDGLRPGATELCSSGRNYRGFGRPVAALHQRGFQSGNPRQPTVTGVPKFGEWWFA